MKLKIFLFLSILFSVQVFAQNKKISHRVYLIGDVGNYPNQAGTILFELEEMIKKDPNSTTLFLGDNIYFQGLEPESKPAKRKDTETRILNQLERLDNYEGKAYFVPGNHDWKAGKMGGYKYVLEQANFVNKYMKSKSKASNNDSIYFVPQNGFPGPYTTKVSDDLSLVAIDTHWWLHGQLFHYYPKKGSRKKTINLFLNELDSVFNVAKINNDNVIMAGHHPFYTYGSHGQKRQPWRFLNNYTPFQIFGLMGGNRLFSQDIHQPRYKKMVKKIMQVVDKYDNIFYVCGHDHNLQYFKKSSHRFIVSGAGSKTSSIKQEPVDAHFVKDGEKGFFIVTYFDDNSVEIAVKLEKKEPIIVDNFELKK
jgi:predicted MPP superfamily phosphohydrolase